MDPVRITDSDFQQLVTNRAKTLLGLASHISRCKSDEDILIRPLLGELLSRAMQTEELLDAYDARNNCRWCSFRSLTAAFKLFADVGYELLHIQHALPAYRLLPIDHDFVKATEHALSFTGNIIRKTAGEMLSRSKQLNLLVPKETGRERAYTEQLPPGRLPHDCSKQRTETISETVTLVSTAFLNLAAESEDIHSAVSLNPKEYASYISNHLSEENLRSLQLRFHNLQSLYDTYVSGTEDEGLDSDLPVLRGHISVVFHLLKTATLFAHYSERHLRGVSCELSQRMIPLLEPQSLLVILMDYSVFYTSSYIACARRLCQSMLKRYIEIERIEAAVPSYRGFHVRPSTLISKLVLHYGSEVRMELDDDNYDAASPLELFRANEKINAQKRRWLAEEISRLKLVPEKKGTAEDIIEIIHDVIMASSQQGSLILYEHPLQLSERPLAAEGTLLEQVVEEIGRLLAVGKIDISTSLKAVFIGDKRVLADIKLLAESGYGEDKFGNNISLPEELSYLRR